MPPVPYTTETLAELQARYPRALEHEYDAVAVAAGDGIRPGEVAANVFDFDDGLRLIISRDRYPDGKVAIHFSASIRPDSRMVEWVKAQIRQSGTGWAVADAWAAQVPARFAELANDHRPAKFLAWSAPKLVPHWIVEE